MTTDVLNIWTVYRQPRDFPHNFVARRSEIQPGVPDPVPTSEFIVGRDLEMIRAYLSKKGLTCIPRSPGDEPHIVEVWL